MGEERNIRSLPMLQQAYMLLSIVFFHDQHVAVYARCVCCLSQEWNVETEVPLTSNVRFGRACICDASLHEHGTVLV